MGAKGSGRRALPSERTPGGRFASAEIDPAERERFDRAWSRLDLASSPDRVKGARLLLGAVLRRAVTAAEGRLIKETLSEARQESAVAAFGRELADLRASDAALKAELAARAGSRTVAITLPDDGVVVSGVNGGPPTTRS